MYTFTKIKCSHQLVWLTLEKILCYKLKHEIFYHNFLHKFPKPRISTIKYSFMFIPVGKDSEYSYSTLIPVIRGDWNEVVKIASLIINQKYIDDVLNRTLSVCLIKNVLR